MRVSHYSGSTQTMAAAHTKQQYREWWSMVGEELQLPKKVALDKIVVVPTLSTVTSSTNVQTDRAIDGRDHPHRMNYPQSTSTQDVHPTLQDREVGRHTVNQSHTVKLLKWLRCHSEQVTLNSEENTDDRSSVMQSITFSTEWLSKMSNNSPLAHSKLLKTACHMWSVSTQFQWRLRWYFIYNTHSIVSSTKTWSATTQRILVTHEKPWCWCVNCQFVVVCNMLLCLIYSLLIHTWGPIQHPNSLNRIQITTFHDHRLSYQLLHDDKSEWKLRWSSTQRAPREQHLDLFHNFHAIPLYQSR